MRTAIVVACVLLAGCATPQERREARVNESRAMCYNMGFQYGTPEHANCTMQVAAQREAANDAARQQAILTGLQILATPPPQPRQPVNCRQIGPNITCW